MQRHSLLIHVYELLSAAEFGINDILTRRGHMTGAVFARTPVGSAVCMDHTCLLNAPIMCIYVNYGYVSTKMTMRCGDQREPECVRFAFEYSILSKIKGCLSRKICTGLIIHI